MRLAEKTHDELVALHAEQTAAYEALVGAGLTLDLTRGKPSAAQLDLSLELLDLPGAGHYVDGSGMDCRNYGGLQGLPQLREIFAPLLGVPVEQLVAGGNASLAIMHDTLVFSLLKGPPDGERWVEEPIKFLCPVPGYDRHFALCEQFGIEMVPVPLGPDGPDLAQVRRLAGEDASVKGMWVVPTYSNPTGAVYGADVTRALLEMPTAAPDFRIFYDNAYAVHHLTDREVPALDVLEMARAAGHPNRVLVFASTSKITFAGAGVAFFAASPDNVAWYLRHLGKRTIGPDKLNHLRHAEYLRDSDGVRQLMRRHREIIAPKFAQVEQILTERLGDYALASWTDPEGGYFVSLDVAEGTATRVVALAKEAGIAMTGAGAAFPYGHDPRDANIRIAPTMPTPDDVAAAIDGLATCVLLAALEQQLARPVAAVSG